MKFGKTRMYKQGSHTPKPGAIKVVTPENVKSEDTVVEVDKAAPKGKDYSGYYKPPKRKYTKKNK